MNRNIKITAISLMVISLSLMTSLLASKSTPREDLSQTLSREVFIPTEGLGCGQIILKGAFHDCPGKK